MTLLSFLTFLAHLVPLSFLFHLSLFLPTLRKSSFFGSRVFMRVCVHACVRACVRACMRACVRACMRACMHACMRACVCVRACVWAWAVCGRIMRASQVIAQGGRAALTIADAGKMHIAGSTLGGQGNGNGNDILAANANHMLAEFANLPMPAPHLAVPATASGSGRGGSADREGGQEVGPELGVSVMAGGECSMSHCTLQYATGAAGQWAAGVRVRAGALSVTAGGKASIVTCMLHHNVVGVMVAPKAEALLHKSFFLHNAFGNLCLYNRSAVTSLPIPAAPMQPDAPEAAHSDALPHAAVPPPPTPQQQQQEEAGERRTRGAATRGAHGGRGARRGARAGAGNHGQAQAREVGAAQVELMSNTLHGIAWASHASDALPAHLSPLLHLRARRNVYIDCDGFQATD